MIALSFNFIYFCGLAQANKELLQIRFSSVDANKLSAWLKKWPFGAKKDGYGLPKTMLPLSAEPFGLSKKNSNSSCSASYVSLQVRG